MLLSVNKAPCSDGVHHTSYVLVDGPGKGEVQPFPIENFQLTSQTHQEETQAWIRKRNLTLVIPA